MIKNVKLRRYLPKELLSDSGKIKMINLPKGKIPSRSAYMLQQVINNQLTQGPTSPIVGHQKLKKL